MIIPYKSRIPDVNSALFIAPNASVIGHVILGTDVSIWFGAVVRGDFDAIVIGDNTNIQDNAILHVDAGFPLEIGKYVTVGHGAVLHGCTIGDNCIIGMGAVILNGAGIGENSIVGAGALVKEREQFPPGSLIIGHPAGVKKPLTGRLAAHLKEAAITYIELAREMAGACG